MERIIFSETKNKYSEKNIKFLFTVILIFAFSLAVFQDYLYSKLQHTSFYISESLLYNTFWTFFVPFFILADRCTKNYFPKNKLKGILYAIVMGILFSVVHILTFSFSFVGVSHLIFTPPHRFSNIFYSALSNQLYIAFLFYMIAPNLHKIIVPKRETHNQKTRNYPEKIKFKIGSKIKTIATSKIQFITTDRPYLAIHLQQQKFLLDKSLKDLEIELDPTCFLRVHRSTIVNHLFVKELKSRKNGDFDAYLENGKTVRLSRHYRINWHQLLQSTIN